MPRFVLSGRLERISPGLAQPLCCSDGILKDRIFGASTVVCCDQEFGRNLAQPAFVAARVMFHESAQHLLPWFKFLLVPLCVPLARARLEKWILDAASKIAIRMLRPDVDGIVRRRRPSVAMGYPITGDPLT